MAIKYFDTDAIEAALPHAELLRVLSYDHWTGEMRWRVTLSNRAQAGAIAGCKTKGYRMIGIYGRLYPAHHIAIYYYSCMYPPMEVDHRDGDGLNNRIDNLRVAGPRMNVENRRSASKNNKTGLLGVYICSTTGRYRTSIRAKGKTVRLGRYDTAQEAHTAYLKAKRELHEGNTL